MISQIHLQVNKVSEAGKRAERQLFHTRSLSKCMSNKKRCAKCIQMLKKRIKSHDQSSSKCYARQVN